MSPVTLDVPLLFTLPCADGALPLPARMSIATLLEHLRTVLTRRFAPPTALELEPAGSGAFAVSGGGVQAVFVAGAGRVAVELDAGAARAVADIVARKQANLRGSGPVSPAERGLVHFALLELADELALLGATGDWRTESLDGPMPALDGACELHLQLQFATGGGAIRVRVAPAAMLLGLPVDTAIWQSSLQRRGNDEIDLHLELPPVAVGRDELVRLVPGSVLLLGCSSLDVAANCELATDNGWSLARGSVRRMPGLATFECVQLGARAIGRQGDRDVLLRPRTAVVRASLNRLAALRIGDRLDLRSPVHRAVQILGPSGIAAEGDLEDVGGELGVRIA